MKEKSQISFHSQARDLRHLGHGGEGGAALTIMSVMVSMVWLMTASASRLCPQSAAVKLRLYVWSVAMMLRRGSWRGCDQNKGERW